MVFSRDASGVPIYERFFLGGINSIRGYRLFTLRTRIQIQNALEPDSFHPHLLGRRELAKCSVNSEIEFADPPAVNIRGVVFFDAGNGYNLEDKVLLKPVRERQPARRVQSLHQITRRCRTCATRSASASAGSHRSVPCAWWGIPLNKAPTKKVDRLEFDRQLLPEPASQLSPALSTALASGASRQRTASTRCAKKRPAGW